MLIPPPCGYIFTISGNPLFHVAAITIIIYYDDTIHLYTHPHIFPLTPCGSIVIVEPCAITSSISPSILLVLRAEIRIYSSHAPTLVANISLETVSYWTWKRCQMIIKHSYRFFM